MKRIVLIQVIFCISLFAMAQTAKTEQVDGVYYMLWSTYAWVTKRPEGAKPYDGEVNIPEQISYEGKIYKVDAISWEAFDNYPKLTAVHLPNTIKRIAGYAFYRCPALTTVNIPESVEEIEGFAFRECDALSDIKIPASIKKMSSAAFWNCKGFPMVNGLRYADNYLIESDGQQASYDVKEGTRWIGDNAFHQNPALKAIELPSSLEVLGNWAFDDCISLRIVDLRNTQITSIPGAFANCVSLTMVILPATLKYIPWDAFSSCWKLTDIYCLAPTAPIVATHEELGVDAFNSFDKEHCRVHIPRGSLFSYKAALGWMSFKHLEEDVQKIYRVAN